MAQLNTSLADKEAGVYPTNLMNDVPPPFDESTYQVIQIILKLPLLGPLSLLGVITNIINFFIFCRQGLLTDSSTITLAGLAVSDFFICLFSGWTSICWGFYLLADVPRLKWDVYMFYIATAFFPKVMFAEISCWVTAFLAFERFVGVMFPFKVKSIFSPKSSLAVVVSIFVLTFILYIPNTFTFLPATMTIGPENITKITFQAVEIFSDAVLMDLFFVLNPMVLRTLSVVLVVFFNFTIFWKVIVSQKFRKSAGATATTTNHSSTRSSANDKKNDSIRKTDGENAKKSSKDANLLRMITIICLVFTLCQLPDIVAVYLFPSEFGGSFHHYTRETVYSSVHILEVLNSSTNIFIYYNMSTRFRKDLRLACCNKKA